jgi:hypothetical protein
MKVRGTVMSITLTSRWFGSASIAILYLLSACRNQDAPPSAPAASVTPAEARTLAKEAYVFALPLPYIETQFDRSTAVTRPQGTQAPANQFAHFRTLPDASDRTVVGMNLDVLLSLAYLDLAPEPIVLSLPDITDRFWLIQFLNAWNDVSHMLGTRASGGKGGRFAIVGPSFTGILPAGLTELRMPTNMTLLGGRIRIESPGQTRTINALQDQWTLTPLSKWSTEWKPPTDVPLKPGVDAVTSVPQQVLAMTPETFFGRVNALLAGNPPYPADAPVLARIAKIGIKPGQPFSWSGFSPEVQSAIADGMKDAIAEIRATPMGDKINGWDMTLDMGRFGTKYALRAANTLFAVGGNPAEDALYPMSRVDATGQKLDGAHRYRMAFPAAPPVDAFWSLYIYNEEFFLVDNPIKRYMLGSRSTLSHAPDGSFIVAIQADRPTDVPESNWLPAPKSGAFEIAMRLYSPKREILTRTWQPPTIKRID